MSTNLTPEIVDWDSGGADKAWRPRPRRGLQASSVPRLLKLWTRAYLMTPSLFASSRA